MDSFYAAEIHSAPKPKVMIGASPVRRRSKNVSFMGNHRTGKVIKVEPSELRSPFRLHQLRSALPGGTFKEEVDPSIGGTTGSLRAVHRGQWDQLFAANGHAKFFMSFADCGLSGRLVGLNVARGGGVAGPCTGGRKVRLTGSGE
jgi:hypothetical protein